MLEADPAWVPLPVSCLLYRHTMHALLHLCRQLTASELLP